MPASAQEQVNLLPEDGEAFVFKKFYAPEQADRLLARLGDSLAWQEEALFIFGRRVKAPRLMCWYGDPGSVYRYSGVDHRPLPWNSVLLELKADVEQACGQPFNSVLANLYRNGRDSMGCHADNEPELGLRPVIASLSFGAGRRFKFHHKKRRLTVDLILEHGDLLVMQGDTQHKWLHSVPKTQRELPPRINLTFRKIFI